MPDRGSNAGPEPQPDPDWRDLLWDADESIAAARKSMGTKERLRAIDDAMIALQAAKEWLCG